MKQFYTIGSTKAEIELTFRKSIENNYFFQLCFSILSFGLTIKLCKVNSDFCYYNVIKQWN